MEPVPGKPDGRDLKELRKLAGYSQEELAEVLDKSRETISAIENNHPNAIMAMTEGFPAKWTLVCFKKARQRGMASENRARTLYGRIKHAAVSVWEAIERL